MPFSFDRRTFLTTAAATLYRPAVARGEPQHLKSIPSTGEKVPAIGMGTWRTFDVGDNEAARSVRTSVLRRFFEMGGAVVDSSPMYGSSQAVVGDVLSRLGRPDALFAADKVWIPGGERGSSQIAETQQRWSIDRFDLLQVHNLVSWRAHLETLLAMKSEGSLRYVGVTSYAGLRYDEIIAIIESHPIDFIQITYNIADREAERRLLPLALEKGVAVIANRPFREGAVIDAAKRRPLPDLAMEIGAANWAQFLLKFIVSHPAVTVTIPATRRVDHMTENMGALMGAIPDKEFRKQMIKVFNER